MVPMVGGARGRGAPPVAAWKAAVWVPLRATRGMLAAIGSAPLVMAWRCAGGAEGARRRMRVQEAR